MTQSDINTLRPSVMCFSGLDPSGGAGIQADIESVFSIGCHCLPIITTLTVQDTHNVVTSVSSGPTLIIEQARAVLEDIPVSAFKLGLLGDIGQIEVIHTLLREYPDIPVVADPVLQAGGGFDFSSAEYIDAYRTLLLPYVTVLTPNTPELHQLAPHGDNADGCATELQDSGCDHILLTGGHEQDEQVINRLYSRHQPVREYTWQRLPEKYHGSGCTMAAALAAYLAHGITLAEAALQAQRFTWESLVAGAQHGSGQWIPNRSHWNKELRET